MKKTHTLPKSRRAKKYAELNKQAVERHPGIKEVTEVYNNQWKELHKVEQAHQILKNPGYKVIYSDSTNPKSFL